MAYGMWMGIFWICIGLFVIIADLMGQAFRIPLGSVQFNPGWIVLALGLLRLHWWRKSIAEPRRHRQALEAKLKEMEADMAERERSAKQADSPS